jgi:hypothetical protein
MPLRKSGAVLAGPITCICRLKEQCGSWAVNKIKKKKGEWFFSFN